MRHGKWVLSLVSISLITLLQGCVETSPQGMIHTNDHESLANYYAQQVEEFTEKAKFWEFMAEYFEKAPDVQGKSDSAQQAARCREISQGYKKAADEADELARKHRVERQHA